MIPYGTGTGTHYTRFSLGNYEWYAWAFVNAHWYLPLALVFLVGTTLAVRRAWQTRRAGYLPELIVALGAGYFGMAFLVGYQDTRYSFPAACFVAALAVGWIAKARPKVRAATTLALLGVFVVNTTAVSTGVFGTVKIDLPVGEPVDDSLGFRLAGGEPITGVQGNVVLISNHGYRAGEPERARTFQLIEAAARDGIAAFSIERPGETAEKLEGIDIAALTLPIPLIPDDDPLIRSPAGITLYQRSVRPSDPPPCQRFSDGKGLYVLRAPTERQLRSPNPRRAPNRYCPL